MQVAIVAPSSVVPPVELDRGVARLREAGLEVTVHPQCRERHFTWAGTDAQRAGAFYEVASDPRFQVIWCARGGYGATRLLPMLKELESQRGVPPRKLLVGYSDITALHAFVNREWGWPTLHASMPTASYFGPHVPEWRAMLAAAVEGRPIFPSDQTTLTFMTPPPGGPIEAPLIGGNLSLVAAMCGTPWFPDTRGNILFIEDVDEAWYRLDRMATQLMQAGAFEEVRAIVLGNFQGCRDDVTTGLREAGSSEQVPLREPIPEDQALAEIFGTVGERLGIPVAKGLPVGHGPDHWPIPLNARYRVHPNGRLELVEWK
ncbi:MAG TPA: LD-carboxypeptidase [Tepidisphaeraceae bacterium]|jgi:muramoyltetrapeptide carboxypeptidase